MALALCLIPFILNFYLFPALKISFLTPYLLFHFYTSSLTKTIWITFGVGLLMDLLSAQTPFGFFPLLFILTLFLLLPIKRFFFEEKGTTYPVLTFLFSGLSTLLGALFLKALGEKLSLSIQWVVADGILYPLGDAFFALVGFTIPLKLLGIGSKKRRIRYVLKKRIAHAIRR